MRAHLNAVLLKIQTVKSHEAMASALRGTTKVTPICHAIDAPSDLLIKLPHFQHAEPKDAMQVYFNVLSMFLPQAMSKMNKVFNLPELNRIMMEFQKEEMKAEMTMEMMGDTMDDVMEGENDEEEEKQIVAQILDEIGISLNGALAEAPTSQPLSAAPAAAAAEEVPLGPVGVGVGGGGSGASPPGASVDPAVSELEERLNNLRRN